MRPIETTKQVVTAFFNEYKKTHIRLKVLDLFAATALLTAIVQFLYARAVGSFPFNAFLAGFFCSLSTFTLTVALRLRADVTAKDGSAERAYGEYALAMGVMFLAAWNYVG